MATLERFTRAQGALLVVDMQEKLLPLLPERQLVVANTLRLIRVAHLLEMPVFATEQYPRGLGPTVPEIAALIPLRPEKTHFNCCAAPGLLEQIHGRSLRHITLAGIETHVCVAQTALELLNMNLNVQVPADAVGSRFRIDWEFGLRRLEHAGAVVTTTESALFEWIGSSDHPHFKAVSQMVKEFSPRMTEQQQR